MPPGRFEVPGPILVQLDGAPATPVTFAGGGEAVGEIVDRQSPDGRVDKRVGGVRFAPIVLEIAPTGGPLLEWITATLAGTPGTKSGTIVRLDSSLREESRLRWRTASITEIALPAADVAVREPATIRVTIQPTNTRLVLGSGVPHPLDPPSRSKTALRSNFSMTISGLEAAGRQVQAVSSVTVTLDAGLVTVADVALRVPVADARPFAEWFDEFVLGDADGAVGERTATLAFLSPDLTEFARVDLVGLGIFRIFREDMTDAGDAQAHMTVEMYCEDARLGELADGSIS